MKETELEQLSVFVDGEHTVAEATAVVEASVKDTDSRAAWQRMHLIGDMLRNDLPDRIDPEFACRVRDQIDTEPTVLAPYSLRYRLLKPVTAVAIAASVAAVAVIGIRQLNENVENPSAHQVAVQQEAGPPARAVQFERPPTSVVHWQGASPAAASRLNSYLVDFSEQRSSLGVSSMPPYVRIVGYEAEQ